MQAGFQNSFNEKSTTKCIIHQYNCFAIVFTQKNQSFDRIKFSEKTFSGVVRQHVKIVFNGLSRRIFFFELFSVDGTSIFNLKKIFYYDFSRATLNSMFI